ncbi:MAG: HEAT repeat domain-containing protein [Geminicoccaceae bacterium]
MPKRCCSPAASWGRVPLFVLAVPAVFFALAVNAGLTDVAAASEVQSRVIADPVARDDAFIARLSFRGKRLGLTQGESPVFDYDGDGKLDILLSAHGTMPWPLMRNQGNDTYSEVLSGTFIKQDRHGCVTGDFGSVGGSGHPDGLIDLYCVIGADRGLSTDDWPNELYLQKPDHSFINVAKAWDVEDSHGRGRAAAAIDYDRDGLLDLAVANEAPSMVPSPNRLFKNVGGRFEEIADPVVRRETASECLAAADVDGDGWIDLLFCSTIDPQTGVLTYKNGSGVFQDVTPYTAYRTVPAQEIKLEDVNQDRKPDLLIVEQMRFTVWLNRSGEFPRIDFSYPLNKGHNVAVGDVNLDGAPDIYIVQGRNDLYDDIMLINDEDGASYHMISIPQASEGEGDVATTIPNWGGSGRAAFLVTNGRWGSAGPVQVIAFSAATAPVQFSSAPNEKVSPPPDWALDGFVAGLDDPDSAVFVQLGGIGHRLGFWSALTQRSKELAPLMVARLSDQDVGVRLAALSALGALGAKESTGAIAENLGDTDASVRRAAGMVLTALGASEATVQVADARGNAETGTHQVLVEAVEPDAKASESAEKLSDPDAEVRRAAVASLTALAAKEQTAALAERLTDANAVVRRAAVGALMQLEAKEQAPAIVARLGDQDVDVGQAAVVALRTFRAKEQIPAIVQLLADPETNTRLAALSGLRALGAAQEIPAVAARLADPDAEVRQAAIDTLRKFGAKEEAQAIAIRLNDPDVGVRLTALAALKALGAKEQSATIVEMLADTSESVRRRVVVALGVLESNVHSRAIAEMLGDTDAGVREAALGALLRLEPHAVRMAVDVAVQDLPEMQQRSDMRAALHVLAASR